ACLVPSVATVRNWSSAAGTTTRMRVFVALLARARTILPSLARRKYTRAPLAKFLPLRVRTWPIRTVAGDTEVTTGRGVRATAEVAIAATAAKVRIVRARRRRIGVGFGMVGIPFSSRKKGYVRGSRHRDQPIPGHGSDSGLQSLLHRGVDTVEPRSEERRVGKECRVR